MRSSLLLFSEQCMAAARQGFCSPLPSMSTVGVALWCHPLLESWVILSSPCWLFLWKVSQSIASFLLLALTLRYLWILLIGKWQSSNPNGSDCNRQCCSPQCCYCRKAQDFLYYVKWTLWACFCAQKRDAPWISESLLLCSGGIQTIAELKQDRVLFNCLNLEVACKCSQRRTVTINCALILDLLFHLTKSFKPSERKQETFELEHHCKLQRNYLL